MLYNIDISVNDLKTLKDKHWLNDNIIDCYMAMLIERGKNNLNLPKIFIFTTHFYSSLAKNGYKGVKRWAKRKKIDVTKMDYIFIPINLLNSHWVLGIINNKKRRFEYLDSLNGGSFNILGKLQEYMAEETERMYPNYDRGLGEFDYYNWEAIERKDIPQQENGSDCGVFTCMNVDFLSQEKHLKFSQNDMKNIRRRMAYSIISGELVE
ncbi:SUMO protease ULP1 [Ascoidea rubescens DSM 1968]|uniref:Cysteine proteinase n=1 Tax=Ascoidea rubescens DSM 1968 TaxID=1344418 RepID=A0A1D2VCU3_9ASCO|nr:cysteine proteinase [Ascoidea rubescens DSM 1968]ODV59429.1 cysteine proteinase [Ascoidea rubescens DSM 1968]